ncbi:unnamed protein product [Prorocentrum cordatum]|uniref:Protein kinase domain-containing protein n=2 Tax=Prorocentrum cordatum TaxID=2364126 RepID=A0ABN9T7P1_9DINO|nr:unnamed protein product [Polarella glacialis]
MPASVTGLLFSLCLDWKKPDTPGSQMGRSEATWKLSDLELGATVGVGSFGRVRVAKVKDSPETTPMALKITHKATLIKKKMVTQIKDEIKVLRMVNHPFLVRLRACWQDERSMYMLMDFVNGGELSTVIKKWNIPQMQGQLWVAELILAIEHMHSKKVAHRDVKPENVLLDRLGHLVLTDFGFAKVADPLLWTKCGTYEYMAPEVVQRTGHGCAVDWWALGVLTYVLFACDMPFHADTKEGTYKKIVKGEYSIPRHLPAEVQDLIRNLLKERSQRLGCMEEGVAGIKKHPWFSTIDFDEVLHQRVPSLCRPRVSSAEDTSRFKTHSESDFDDPPALSVEQQALFDFDVCEGRTSWDESSERFLPGYGCCSIGGRKQDLVEFAEVNHSCS